MPPDRRDVALDVAPPAQRRRRSLDGQLAGAARESRNRCDACSGRSGRSAEHDVRTHVTYTANLPGETVVAHEHERDVRFLYRPIVFMEPERAVHPLSWL